MLELRLNCELCDVDLPPASPHARICSDECTCAACIADVLHEEIEAFGETFRDVPPDGR